MAAKQKNLSAEQLEHVARLFRTLGDPTRLRILQLLQTGEMTVSDIVDQSNCKQANVSKQLGILHNAGLVERTREGSYVYYTISDPMIFELCSLVCGKFKRDARAQLKAFGSVR